jgi:hypothetical protein
MDKRSLLSCEEAQELARQQSPEGILQPYREAMANRRARQEAVASNTPPAQYLTNWREILTALGMKNNAVDREKVRALNQQYGGPIVTPRRGAQPKVSKAKLIDWWNGLEAQWTTGGNRACDAAATVASQHAYGRDGTVAPDISGEVKRRRSDRRR